MRLTLSTDFSVRVLIFAALRGDELTTIDEIAGHFDISRNHLMKVVHSLGRNGYLETVRGKHGGLRLTRKPSQINIGTLVRETEDEVAVLGCHLQEDYCRIQQCCVLRSALRDAANAFLAVLDQYTLQDMIKPKNALARALGLN